MIAHLQAIQTLLVPSGLRGFRFDAPRATAMPYFVLSSRSWDSPLTMPLIGTDVSLATDIRVTAVAGTPDGAVYVLDLIRDVLSPAGEGDWTAVPLTGRKAQISWVRSEMVDVDRDVTIPGTDRNPGVGVDTYRLISQPA